MTAKAKITITIDRDLIEAAEAAVESGKARSVSDYINGAVRDRAERHARSRQWLDHKLAEMRSSDPGAFDAAGRRAAAALGIDPAELDEQPGQARPGAA
ncbi:ribbon-helix-helix domain-containing protein [Actinomadura rudentiformis]|uniref:Ribbon-helix-helix protein, CopG family n=1 Tax=Actinomadura rudentiformis TaxID=359158 RepID=A0A6H9YNT1_9ACTN|nr:ribbon-helix-helix domain-containing protein [Actinomadura rudentiformis]KAB2340612.1 hypothetical protein F8566_44640 [Actinomadura rudentiformis]